MAEDWTLSDKRKRQREDLEYLFSKVNWGASFLDAQAITIMNEFWKNINESDKEFIKRLKLGVWDLIEDQYENQNVYEFIDKLAGDKLV